MAKFPPKTSSSKGMKKSMSKYGPTNMKVDLDTSSKDSPGKMKNSSPGYDGAGKTPPSAHTIEQSSSAKGKISSTHDRGGMVFDNNMKSYHHDAIEHDSDDR